MSRLIAYVLILIPLASAFGQGFFSGDLEIKSDFYQRDSTINAVNTPHYDNLLSSTDAWANLRYTNLDYGFEAGLRVDLFLNSNLHNPGSSYTAVGIGRWFLSKSVRKLHITAGYFYDQFGSGIVFRAYEDRALGIDNSILGIHLEYEVNDAIRIKAFTGVMKDRFDLYKGVFKGINGEASYQIGDNLTISPGLAIVNRTMDQESMSFVVDNIETLDAEDRFVPKFNVFLFSGYSTLNVKGITWYVEGAYKTHEAIGDLNGKLIDEAGNVFYTNLTYSRKGFGISGQFKRTQNFPFRNSPNETLLTGIANYIPAVPRQNSLRLPARYTAFTQEVEELSYGADLTWKPYKGYTISANYSDVRDFSNQELFKEAYVDVEFRVRKKWRATIGGQYVRYAQAFFENDPILDSVVKAYTPFVEFVYKFDRKKSIRAEIQYQYTKEDFGSWIYGLVEFNIAPSWSFSVSDMYNYDPNPHRINEKVHYYNVFGSFTHGPHRFSLAYVKQIEGIVCTGGVCRLEPAFSGVKFTLTSTF